MISVAMQEGKVPPCNLQKRFVSSSSSFVSLFFLGLRLSVHVFLLESLKLLFLLLLLLSCPPTTQERSIVRQRLEPEVHDDECQGDDEGGEDPPPVCDCEDEAVWAEEDGAEEGLWQGGGVGR